MVLGLRHNDAYVQVESGANLSANNMRCELGAVMYQYNVLGTRGPRKMTALLPRVDTEGHRTVFRPNEDDNEGITN